MKKALKVLLVVILSFLVITSAFFLYCFIITKDVKLDEKKLIDIDKSITYLNSTGEIMLEEVKGASVCDNKDIPSHVKNAFISIEDKRFYSHNGVDIKGLIRAIIKNLKSMSFKEGASTITQQLVKNTHLSNEKTLKRKLSEIKIALEIEKKYSKDEILEKYLNTIYFGSGKYGINDASKYYFSKTPNELTINEGAILASIIKAPYIYSPTKNESKCFERKNLVLKQMLDSNYVTHNQYEKNKQLPCEINIYKNDNSFMDLIKSEVSNAIENTPYFKEKLTVYTSINKEYQKMLEENNKGLSNKYSSVMLNNKNEIEAFYSNGEIEKRQVGSTIKPLLSFAPAIENNVVFSMSKILDEKQEFSGYSPSNYNDRYYGYVSIKEALQKSLNTPAVKLLNDTGIERASNYLKKMDYPLDSEDNNLALALGATKYGASLIDITSCYNVFINNGNYIKPSIIEKITCNNRTIYEKNNKKTKVFSSDTVSILNDMLLSVTKEGTAKKLSILPFPVYSKTGTVGNSLGNTDAYSISYNSEHLLGVWIGNNKGEYLKNNLTGGTLPTEIALNLWKETYNSKIPPKEIEKDESVTEEYIDKISYDKENVLILADDITPERFKIKALFKKDNLPKEKSNRYSQPKIYDYSATIIEDKIQINCLLDEGVNYLVKKYENGVYRLVFDSKMANNKVFNEDFIKNENLYILTPYFENVNNKYYGEEVYVKIKSPSIFDGDDWWTEDELN